MKLDHGRGTVFGVSWLCQDRQEIAMPFLPSPEIFASNGTYLPRPQFRWRECVKVFGIYSALQNIDEEVFNFPILWSDLEHEPHVCHFGRVCSDFEHGRHHSS